MAGNHGQPGPCLILAEGSNVLDHRDRDAFVELWRYLGSVCGLTGSVDVIGFSKGDVLALDPDRMSSAGIPLIAPMALDEHIRSACSRTEYSRIFVAFDRTPPNQLLQLGCIRAETTFILERFVARQRIPQRFLDASGRLLGHYNTGGTSAMRPRPAGIPPRELIEFICMTPEFEAMVVADEQALKRALGFTERPKDWPWSKRKARRQPKAVLQEAIALARQSGVAPVRIRGDYKCCKHEWALQILRASNVKSSVLHHEIAQRLRLVFLERPV